MKNSEGEITTATTTPGMGDSVWVDAWPKADQRPSFNPCYGWKDGGMGRYLISRLAAGATVSREMAPSGTALGGAGNMVYADGHADLVRLPRLWQLTWHRGYVRRPTRPAETSFDAPRVEITRKNRLPL